LNIGRFTQTTIPPIDIKSPEVLIKYFKGIPDENTNT
jgi:hypothetical protein